MKTSRAWWLICVAATFSADAAAASAQLVGVRGGWHRAPFDDFPNMLGPAALVVISPLPRLGLRAAFASATGTRSPTVTFCDSYGPDPTNCGSERSRTTGDVEMLELGVMAFAAPLRGIRFGGALSASRHDLDLNAVSRESGRRKTIFVDGPAWGASASVSADAPLPFAPRFYASLEVQRSWYSTGPCVTDAPALCGDVRATAIYAGLSYRLSR